MKYGLASKSKAGATKRVKVMVSLRGFDTTAKQSAAATTPQYASKRAEYAARKNIVKSKQVDLLTWLNGAKGDGLYRKASAPTVFGTFTVEVSEGLIPILERSPLVESVLRVEDTPMVLLGDGASAASTTR